MVLPARASSLVLFKLLTETLCLSTDTVEKLAMPPLGISIALVVAVKAELGPTAASPMLQLRRLTLHPLEFVFNRRQFSRVTRRTFALVEAHHALGVIGSNADFNAGPISWARIGVERAYRDAILLLAGAEDADAIECN